MIASLQFVLLAPLLATQVGPPLDWTIPAGQTVTFAPGPGVLEFANLTIEAGARLRFVGPCATHVRVQGTLRIDGTLDVAGNGFASGVGVTTFNTTNLQEPGLLGGPGGMPGGTGNRLNFGSSAMGGPGGCEPLTGSGGGGGGETAFAPIQGDLRHGAGGGGGGVGPPMANGKPHTKHNSKTGRVAPVGRDR